MERWNQSEAAAKAKLDARTFRTFVDSGMVHATKDSRSKGRGSTKFFSKKEVQIANLLGRLHAYGFTRANLFSISDALRRWQDTVQSQLSDRTSHYVALRQVRETNISFWKASSMDSEVLRTVVESELEASRPMEVFLMSLDRGTTPYDDQKP
ncbi:MAG: hypothetical protein RLZ98_3119 [Pseudomonadota bacterium]|jgi:hypothetical protein